MDLTACRNALDAAIDASGRLGLRVDDATATRDRIAQRGGFPGDVYVLALAGGTGVGKSSLLNALASTEVSRAGARRPTTSEPVAFVRSSQVAEVGPLIDWLGGARIETHNIETLRGVCILDLPDLDSIAPDHRARVDSVLPRIDAVLWVTDPEKYGDAVFHDDYLRRWVRRLDRQAIVINKSDRLEASDGERLRADLGDRLGRAELPGVPVLVASANGALDELHAWLASGVEAKRVVTGRLGAQARAQIVELCSQAGVAPDGAPADPLVSDRRRVEAGQDVLARVMAVIDLPGVERQAAEATRLAARPRGGGPLGLLRTILERGSGRSERVADPEGYLRRWRDRGSLVAAAQPVRELVSDALREVPAPARPSLAPLGDGKELVSRLGQAIDRAVVAGEGRFRPPTSRLWPLLGIAQYAATAVLAAGIIWIVALFAGVGRAETPLLDVPVIGPVPTPVVLVAGGLLLMILFGRILLLHAGWLGRRWAASLRERIVADVERLALDVALRPLASFETARGDLATAAGASLRSCVPSR